LILQKIIYHSPQQHIIEGVDPQRSEQDQEELWIVCSLRRGVLGTNATNDEGCCFPNCSHNQGPAKGFAEVMGLEDVKGGSDSEQNRKEDGRWE